MSGLYWCHECKCRVSVITSSEEITCSTCGSVFCEEIELSDDPQQFQSIQSPPTVSTHTRSVSVNYIQPTQNAMNLFANFVPQNHPSQPALSNQQPENIHLIMAMMTRMMRNQPMGQRVQLPFQFPFQMMHNDQNRGFSQHGDYVVGDLQGIINQLMQMDTARSNPTSQEALKSLHDLTIDSDTVGNFTSNCGVCQEEFKEGEIVNTLPCCHYFHKDCVRPWLDVRCTCPMCRWNLNTGRIEPDKRSR